MTGTFIKCVYVKKNIILVIQKNANYNNIYSIILLTHKL